MRSQLLVTTLLLAGVTAFAQTAQPDQPKAISSDVITQAHAVFLTESLPSGHQDPSFQIFRATLQSTGRFQIVATARQADLLLIFGQVIGRTVPPLQAPLLVLEAHDPHTFANLGAIQVPWAVLPSLEKDQSAVTLLMKALFELDKSGPPPSFQIATVPVNSLAEHLTTPLTILKAFLPPPMSEAAAKELTAAHTAFLADSGPYNLLPPEYAGTAASAFTTALTNSGHLRLVSSLDQADLLIRISVVRMYQGDDTSSAWTNYLAAQTFSAVSLDFLTGATIKAPNGKKKSPAPVPAIATKLEAELEKNLASAERKAAKK